MGISYSFAKGVIIVEFTLVLAVVFFTVMLKFLSSYRQKKAELVKTYLVAYLKQLVHSKQRLNADEFQSKWKKLPVLLQAIKHIDETNQNRYWDNVRKDLVIQIGLPLARKATISQSWDCRLDAAKAFGLLQNKGDDEFIGRLVNDDVPLVFLAAGKAALINHSETAINSMISKMSATPRGSQLIYLKSFKIYPPKTRKYFVNKLQTATDSGFRAVCYNILLLYQPAIPEWNLNHDVHSEDADLRIAAIKYIAYSDRESAIPTLIASLSDSDLAVKLNSIQCLDELKAEEAIPQLIKYLNNPDWWVRMSTIAALKNIGRRGEVALRSRNISVDKAVFDSSHLPDRWW